MASGALVAPRITAPLDSVSLGNRVAPQDSVGFGTQPALVSIRRDKHCELIGRRLTVGIPPFFFFSVRIQPLLAPLYSLNYQRNDPDQRESRLSTPAMGASKSRPTGWFGPLLG